jgi:hypothetical protein
MKKRLLAAALVLPLTLSGCVVSVGGDDGDYGYNESWHNQERKNRKMIADLSTNMDITTIKKRMGTPDFNELHQRGDDEYQVLFYRTQRKEGDGVTTKDECTQLVFKNGILVGWGDTAYDNI